MQHLVEVSAVVASFDNIKVVIFCAYGLITPILVPKIRGLGDSTPKWPSLSTTPQKAPPIHGHITSLRSVHPFLHSSSLFYRTPKILCFTMLFNRPDIPKSDHFRGFLDHPTQHPNCILIGSAVLAQLTANSPYSLPPPLFPLKIAPANDPHLIRGSFGPPQST